MLFGAILFLTAFMLGFGFLTVDAMRSGRLRGIGWSVDKSEAPIRYWIGVCGYSLNFIFALVFTVLLVGVLLVP